MPNSHLITLVERYDEDELIATGSRVADDSVNFPIGANVSFVQRLDESEVFIRTFERGAGLTDSCGSGISASRAPLSRLGLIDPDTRVLVRDYVYAAATRDGVVGVWNDARDAADCPAVDRYRASLEAGAPTAPPAPATDCPATFGNSDIYGGRFADPTP